ncbi:rip defective [Colletotrichum truncatum]|uniref:Rip defective n=1 Tax=Colletotrichum truncatum TaxID=5467 RepID=A0ACC3Z0G9_COLTU|nr:rip defective [Colletotrichum truncatum]KAF6800665.1 rip defective [Colletotrichum truncatum]
MGDLYAGGSPQNAIDLEYDESIYSAADREVADLNRQIHNYRRQKRRSFTVASEWIDEARDEEIACRELADLIDLTVDDEPIFVRQSRKQHSLPGIQVPEKQYMKYERNGKLPIRVNKLYELKSTKLPNSNLCLGFILVTSITQDLHTRHVKVCGTPFYRSRALMGKLPRKLNEIYALYELEEDDSRPPEQQAQIEVSLTDLLKPRTLHLTNAPYPKHRYERSIFTSLKAIQEDGPLVCRWRYILYYRGSKEKLLRKPHHWTLERINANDVRHAYLLVEEDALRAEWRGETILGGSYTSMVPGSNNNNNNSEQKYTVVDAFSGAGGFSRGAERSRLHIKCAIDHWDKACNTYRLNFPTTELFQMSVDEFLLVHDDIPLRADILHLSPPCQTWSPAHTIPGKNDEANIAALFACRSLVEKVRPRIFTLEQTFGILQSCHDPFFSCLVGGFTELGYSVSWKIVHLQTWGLPQVRKRLIMIGACPGEQLPPFPSATHSEAGADGLSRYVTARQSLSRINGDLYNHEPEEPRDVLPNGSVICEPDKILPRCITCSGGQNFHWDLRPFTPREFACLQGFPTWHKFAGESCLKKQIGNAFPPCVVRLLCEHIKNWLLERDGLASSRMSRASRENQELILVSATPSPPPPVLPSRISGNSSENAIVVFEDEVQCEIKYDFDSDTEMGDVLDVPDSPRSATLSLGTPEPLPIGYFKQSAIVID